VDISRCGDCGGQLDSNQAVKHTCMRLIQKGRDAFRSRPPRLVQDGIVFQQEHQYFGYLAWRYVLEHM
jgi:hypothetical protein